MATWIGLLRAINLGAKRRFSPGEIVACLEAAGFTDVATHINTGNVRFSTTMRSRQRIVAAMEAAFLDDRGFEVPVVLLTPAELRACADELDEVAAGHEGAHYVSFLAEEPSPEIAAALDALAVGDERAVVRGRAVHVLLGENVHASRLSNAKVERLAGVATSRNRAVVTAMADTWCGG